jgi:hypothetical protein
VQVQLTALLLHCHSDPDLSILVQYQKVRNKCDQQLSGPNPWQLEIQNKEKQKVAT